MSLTEGVNRMRNRLRLIVFGAMLSVMVLGMTVMAWATTTTVPPDVVLTDAAETVFTSLMATAVGVLPYAALLLAFFIGWRILRRFMRTS